MAGEPGGNGGALNLTANSGNITIDGNINLNGGAAPTLQQGGVPNPAGGNGGSLTLMTGDIMIGNVNSSGGKGGRAFGDPATAGNGGNGGVIMITASGTATIGGLTARGGEAGDNVGGATAGSAGAGGQAMITASGGDLTLMGSINVSGGALTLMAPGNNIRVVGSVPTLTASTVTINQGDNFANNLIVAEATSLILTTTRAQIVHPWMTAGSNRSLSLTSNGAIIISENITLGSGNLTLNGMGGITVNGNRTLSGGAINLTGTITNTDANLTLTITAMDDITLNSNIDLNTTSATLILTAGNGGAGNIMGSNALELTANQIDLTQDAAFGATFASTVGGAFALFTDTLNLTTATDQTVHDWMNRTNRTLSLTTTGVIMIGRDIIAGTGNLTLDGSALTLSGGARTLSGANVTLTGNADNATGALTLMATGTADAQ